MLSENVGGILGALCFTQVNVPISGFGLNPKIFNMEMTHTSKALAPRNANSSTRVTVDPNFDSKAKVNCEGLHTESN